MTKKVSRTKLGRYILKNELSGGDSVQMLMSSVSDQTANSWSLQNWITNQGVWVVTSFAVEQAKKEAVAKPSENPWSKKNIPDPETRKEAVIRRLEKELQERGHAVETGGVTYIDDIYTGFSIGRELSSHWDRKNKLRISYDKPFRGTQQRPEPKAGFDIDTIVQDLINLVQYKKERKDRQEMEAACFAASKSWADEINEKFGLSIYGPVSCSGSKTDSVLVQVSINVDVRPGLAERLFEVLKDQEPKNDWF